MSSLETQSKDNVKPQASYTKQIYASKRDCFIFTFVHPVHRETTVVDPDSFNTETDQNQQQRWSQANILSKQGEEYYISRHKFYKTSGKCNTSHF